MRGKPNHVILPEISLQTVWDQNTKAPSKKPPPRHKILTANLQYFDTKAKEGILNELLEIEAASLRQNNRLYFIREKTIEENFQSCRQKCLNAHVSQEFNIQPARTNWLYRVVHNIKRKSVWRKLIS